MWFLRPLAFIGLIILPMILALYFFKNRQKEVKISSTFLWNIAQQNQSAKTSFQKLRKSLLMLLQLAAALFCVLAMTSPYIKAEHDVNNYKLVIDNSLSMSATDGKTTRLDEAKAEAAALVKNSAYGSSFSVVALSDNQYPVVTTSKDKAYVIDEINAIKQSYVPVDYSLMPAGNENENMVVFSDMGIDAEYTSSYIYGSPFNNCGIIALTADYNGKNVRVLGKVKNFGDVTVQNQISIYADEKLYSTEDINLAPDETKDVVFTQLDGGVKQIKAQLQQGDSFQADDIRYAVVAAGTEKRVFLASENPFLERALSVMPDVKIYKDKGAGIEDISGYNLYIFENRVPEKLPEDGHIILINPGENNLFKVDGEVEIDAVSVRANPPIELTNSIEFDVYKTKSLTLPTWGKEIVTSDKTPVIFMGNLDKQKVVVFGFDLTNSDLPLKMDFPIFIYDILNNLFPNGAVENGHINVGTKAELNISPGAESVGVIQPDGTEAVLAPPFPVQPFMAESPGIYYLEQLIGGTKVYEPFAVNIDYSDEQYFNYQTEGDLKDNVAVTNKYNYDLVWIFILLTLILLVAEFALYVYKHKSSFSRIGAVLRIAVITLLITSFFEPKINLPAKGITTVFAVDVSDSMSDNIKNEFSFINEALADKPKEDYTAIAMFGKNGEIHSSAASESKSYKPADVSDSTATNIQAGAETASSLFKNGTGKRLVLLTDGSENKGDIISTINSLKNDGVQVKLVGYGDGLTDVAEVQVTELKVPEYLSANQCNAELLIESTAAQEVNIQLFASGDKVYDSNAELTIGENRFTIKTDINGQGNIDFKAVINPVADKYYENNVAYAHSYIKTAPTILLLDYENSGTQMEGLLRSSGVLVNRRSITAAPQELSELNKYEAVVMADCPYYEMSQDFVTALESYVKNSAGGLFVTAGGNALAPGGYKDTVLESILPVNMDMSDTDKKKNSAIVMVVDRSGSMSSGNYGISKLELVKEAMVRSAQTLDEADSIGVLAFDDAFEWVLEPRKIGSSIKNIENKIYSINDGGGTSIQPAFNEAVDILSSYNADSKHIILMTDGQGEETGYEKVISKALQNNISVSTVAVGDDSAQTLLKNIAVSAGGRYYYTDEFSDLPKIFERETAISNKKYINNEEFYPVINGSFGIMSGIDNMPMLGGYVAADKKAAADTVLTHNNNEPILAVWQYGLGHTGVFAADINNQCVNWMNTDEGQTILKNAVSAIMRTRSFDSVETELAQRGDKQVITVQTKKDNILGITSTIDGDGYSKELIFEQIGAGVFEAAADIPQAGNYVLNLNMSGDDGNEFASSVISVPYSKEYEISNIKSGAITLNKLYNLGEQITESSQVFTDYKEQIFDKLDISLYLMIIALILFFAELFLRRFKPVIKRTEKAKLNNKAKTDENKEPKPDVKKNLKHNSDNNKQEQPKEQASTSSILLKNKQKREK